MCSLLKLSECDYMVGVSIVKFIRLPADILLKLHVQEIDYPVVRMMARDYIGILGSTCLSEWSFSISGCTDLDPLCRKMNAQKFGHLQQLKAAYRDGWLNVETEAWLAIDPDFDYMSDIDVDME